MPTAAAVLTDLCLAVGVSREWLEGAIGELPGAVARWEQEGLAPLYRFLAALEALENVAMTRPATHRAFACATGGRSRMNPLASALADLLCSIRDRDPDALAALASGGGVGPSSPKRPPSNTPRVRSTEGGRDLSAPGGARC